jgi:heme exporter protein C
VNAITALKKHALLLASVAILGINSAFIFTVGTFARSVYEIFYYHVASAWLCYFAFGMSVLFNFILLKTNKTEYYYRAKNSVVVGVIFCGITIVAGSLWFNATSAGYTGVYWDWSDPRETTTLVLFFAYFAYLLFTGMFKDADKKARLSAVLGILLFPMVPLSYLSMFLFNTLHPLINPNPGQPGNIYYNWVKLTLLMINLVAITLLYFYVVQQLSELDKMKLRLEEITKNRMDGA